MTKYIVPFDFGVSGESSLNYAIQLAEGESSNVTILHVAKNEDGKKEAESRLIEILKTKPSGIESKVIIGDLINDLASQSVKLNGTAVVMAKHHEHGLSKMFGSTAIKVITDYPEDRYSHKSEKELVNLLFMKVFKNDKDNCLPFLHESCSYILMQESSVC